jgi:NADH dehydrogenase
VATVGRLELSGFAAWALWLVVHLTFLVGFKNRLATVASWAVTFVGRGRRQRTITKQQVFARTRGPGAPDAAAVPYLQGGDRLQGFGSTD